MADDGMLLNFSIPETGILSRPSLKGGNWRDRAAAKKAAQNWHTKASARLTGEKVDKVAKKIVENATDVNRTQLGQRTRRASKSPEVHEDIDRPAKRARVSGDFRPKSNEKSAAEAGDYRPQINPGATQKPSERQSAPKGAKGGKQVISSLFTYNPTSTTKTQAPEKRHDEEPIEPSNAPLSSELDTFTSLGISTTLAAHLLKKMDLKAPTAIQKAAITQLVKDDSDAFIQAETGSGKTLAYLLPIVQRLMELSANTKKHKDDDAVQRNSGLFAIIMAPTRELSKQIALVLEKLLGCAHWLVATTVIGGEKKKSEKARLRKGINILVATPGRLADHLEHTEALDVSNVRWLVLDEGDRLMELGFEQEIQKIVGALNLRMRGNKTRIPGLPDKRTTVLCSATMKMDVERLGQISLKDAVHLRADPTEREQEGDEPQDERSYAPAQLKQSYAVVAPKLRLVSLIAYLKRAFTRKGSVMKAIVFVSCADSVDFHFDILTSNLEEKNEKAEGTKDDTEEKADDDEPKKSTKKPKAIPQADPTKLSVTHAESPVLSPKSHAVTAYRLHGSLQQSLRTSTLAHFTKNNDAAVLIATDVASRGLDLPNVDLVVEFDPAFAREDHLHRIGRTARAGRDGRACIFLMPGPEEGYVDILKTDRKDNEAGITITRQDADDILTRGLVTSGIATKNAYMDIAQDLQLNVERWALASPARLESARRAFQSHIRAYATHVADERKYFDIKSLHLGHLAKAFALRERPSGMKAPGLRTGAGRNDRTPAKIRGANAAKIGSAPAAKKAVDLDIPDAKDTEGAAKMRKAVRAREKFMRHAGMADEFNLG
ncbi:ATP-dependent RNA helicase DBP7 [Parastagonospora nodorum]|nr:ATP-dependent RNA helicase DBP7 [Parastagonospora nodorum]KAH5803457.1 ATP-dependent RNA helicase DBP7 [Parastagonospora nodorum]KAH5809090.1 ATP-dependent RNA helicase DBP7 [Parastagonospora nodorum]KAH5837785.1 ATP-dependent RNA helicase DBP7 [Parastagonospora nodorum]KAH5852597.1 ATP-dependent RNA helicase DBP7 [Parastagonospora nodorum]